MLKIHDNKGIGLFGAFLFSQPMRFSETWPKMVEKFNELFSEATAWALGHFDISPQKISEWVTKSKGELITTSGTAIGINR